MNSTLLAVIGGALLLGLAVLGLTGWGWGDANSMPAAMAQSQASPMSMMQGMGGMMGPMESMMQGGNMMGSGNGMAHMQGGMMGASGHCGGMQTHTAATPQQPEGKDTK